MSEAQTNRCKGSYRGGAWYCVCGADSPKDCPLHNTTEATVAVPIRTLSMLCTWLRATLECENFVWDGDQHEAASQTLAAVDVLLPIKHR